MGRGNYHGRRRSAANTVANDVAYIGNRLPWWGAALFGIGLWLFFGKLLPALLSFYLEANLSNSPYKAALIQAVGRRLHWLEYLGIALGLIAGFFAVRNYRCASQLNARGERNVSLLGRLLGRFLP